MQPAINSVSSRNSKLAIWSLIFALFTPFPPFVAVFGVVGAIVCGHLGLSAIKKSDGLLRGRGMAIVGAIVGYGAGIFLTVYFTVVYPAAAESTNRVIAEIDLKQILAMMENYDSDYGRYPIERSVTHEVTFSNDNNRLFDILSAAPGTEKLNGRRAIYFRWREAKANPPRDGIGKDGVIYDPWGKPYQIRINPDHEGHTTNPYSRNAGPNPVHHAVIAWSLGADGELGRHGDGDASADIISWR